jgi:hypothetical protein
MKTFIKFIFGAVLLVAVSSCSESFDRLAKDFESDFGGGLNRKITVYDYNGNLVKTWEGKFDTQMGNTSGVPYVEFDRPDSTGKKVRVIVQGGIIINEEL